MRITKIEIERLFNTFDHTITLKNDERVTIIHGTNGVGKTTILRLVNSLFSGSLREIREVPFKHLALSFDDGHILHVFKGTSRHVSRPDYCKLALSYGSAHIVAKEFPILDPRDKAIREIESQYPYIQRVDDDLWEDTRDGEILDSEDLLGRFSGRVSSSSPSIEVRHIEWLNNIILQIPVRFVETQRLLPARKADLPRRHLQMGRVRRLRNATSSANSYALQLSSRIKQVLAQYADLSQKRDQTFPTRLLAKSWANDPRGQNATQSEADLSKAIYELEEKRNRLKAAGLLMQDDQKLQVPEKIEPSLQTALSLYLMDVAEKLEVFDDLLQRIELLKLLLDEHFHHKKTITTRDEGLKFISEDGQMLSPSSLSSGEQHILVMLYELFFVDKPNSLILIDEPEISLHVEWQLSFLNDLQRIASIASHDILIATHSPQIINERWDLTVPLKSPVEK